MEVLSIYKYARISPLKVRDIAREITGLPVSQALDLLNFTPKKSAGLVSKTLRSAIANAENNFELDADTMVVKEAQVNEGPRLKRFRPRARGSAAPIVKKTCHIRIIISDEVPLPEPKEKKSGGRKKAKADKKTGSAVPAAVAEESAVEPEAVKSAETEQVETEK